jgi:hypothetical protein
MEREYSKHLHLFFAERSPFLELLPKKGLHSPQEAVLESLEEDTKCGQRPSRLIRKGGDVITRSCERAKLPKCMTTFEEYLTKRPLWKSTTTSTTIFNQVHNEGKVVQPFIRLQLEEESDLCYLIQSSNTLFYYLTMRNLRGDETIQPFKLNNARHIRDIYSSDVSCKHVFVAFGGTAMDTLTDILQLSNAGGEREDMLAKISTGTYDLDFLFTILEDLLKTHGPAIVDIRVFDEFQKKDSDKFAGDFSGKAVTKGNGKHTLSLIGVRKSTKDDTKDGGGYYGVFQNTWKNSPIWDEIGFDLLESMECHFHFISAKLRFEKEFDSDGSSPDEFAQSSMPPPEFTVCERCPGTATAMGLGDSDHEGGDSDDELGEVIRHTMPSSFDFNPVYDQNTIYLINSIYFT